MHVKRNTYSQTPYVDGAQITVRKGGNDSIKGIEDLDGKTVAVNLGSNFEQLLRSYDKDGQDQCEDLRYRY